MKPILLTILSVVLIVSVYSPVVFGQSNSSIVPASFSYDQTVTMNGQTRSLNHLKGKPLVIELFSSTCVVCFRQMPKMQEMYLKYKDRLGILLLGDENVRLPKIYERFRVKLGLQFDTGFDSALYRQFDPPYVPTYIWIDANGIERGRTGPLKFIPEVIEQFLSGDYTGLQKEAYREKRAMFDGRLLAATDFSYRSVITNAIDTLGLYVPELADTSTFFQVVNASIGHLYRYAYFAKPRIDPWDPLYSNIIADPFIENISKEDSLVLVRKLFCYSIRFPGPRPPATLQKTMRNDLENAFGYKARIETRMMPYHALIFKGKDRRKLCSTSLVEQQSSSYSHIEYKKMPLKELVRTLEFRLQSAMPFVDETGITCPVDLSLQMMVTDMADVKQALEGVGLLLVKRYKPMKVLVLRPLSKTIAAK